MKRHKKILSLIASCALGISISQAVTVREDVWNDPTRMDAVYQKASELTSVAEIMMDIFEGTELKMSATVGTGVLIEDNVVLTAAHIFSSVTNLQSLLKARGGSLRFFVNLEDLNGKKTSIDIKEIHTNPCFESMVMGLCDVAILELEESVDTEIFQPSPLFRGNPRELIGKDMHAAGYGYFGHTESEQLQPHDGKKRYYEFRYDAYDNAKEFSTGYLTKKQKTLNAFTSVYRLPGNKCRQRVFGTNSEGNEAFDSFQIEAYMSEFYGRSALGDSGGPHFNEDGEVVSLTSTANTLYTDYFSPENSSPECLSLDHNAAISAPENLQWIDAMIAKIQGDNTLYDSLYEPNEHFSTPVRLLLTYLFVQRIASYTHPRI